jgi:hypothetical protein
MVALSRNKQEKDHWKQLAERFFRYAENFEREEKARAQKPRRTPRDTSRIKGLAAGGSLSAAGPTLPRLPACFRVLRPRSPDVRRWQKQAALA